jgi:phosphoenolpyruvate carboxykinase (ATP)
MATTDGHGTLAAHGIATSAHVYWNLSAPVLYEHALRRNEGVLTVNGPLMCRTGLHTGRSHNDKFVVKEPSSEAHVHWGKVNRPMSPDHFARLRAEIVAHLAVKDLFVQNLHAGADPVFRLPVRVVSELAWHASLSATCSSCPRTLSWRPISRSSRSSARPPFRPIRRGTARDRRP